MTANVIGISVIVTLKDKTVVQGTVARVIEHPATLTLDNVIPPGSRHPQSNYVIPGSSIAEISCQPKQHSPVESATAPPKHEQAFVDPAILSVGKKPAGVSKAVANTASPVKQPSNSSSKKPSTAVAKSARRRENPAILTRPFNALSLGVGEDGEESDDLSVKEEAGQTVSISKTRVVESAETGRKEKTGAKGRSQKKGRSPEVTHQNPASYRGKGWRQTPMLQDPPALRTPGLIGGKVGMQAAKLSVRKMKKQKALEGVYRWATEDATGVHELPDFDFAGNLSKFDKRTVFEQIRNEDTTADEDRLVSFNRLPSRATAAPPAAAAAAAASASRNLRPTENVLEQRRSHFPSGSNTSSDDGIFDLESGRTSRRAMSRASTRHAPFRSNGNLHDDNRNTSTVSLSRWTRTRRHKRSPGAANSSANSAVVGQPTPSSSSTASLLRLTNKACFRVILSGNRCHVATPGKMAAMEEAAEVNFGLNEDVMGETAARGIASVALQAVNPGGRRLARENLTVNQRPVVVVLAGNHRSGARALAAARQLRGRGLRIVVALLGYERPDDYDGDVQRQLERLDRLGRYVRGWPDVQRALKKRGSPPELIVDALLGRDREFGVLDADDRATAAAMVGWANQSRASVLAVDGPSGVDGTTGEVGIVEGEPLEVRAKYVVCLAAPLSGLLRAVHLGHVADANWLMWVVDLGLNDAWRLVEGTSRNKKCVRFGSDWTVKIRFDGGEAEADGKQGDLKTGVSKRQAR